MPPPGTSGVLHAVLDTCLALSRVENILQKYQAPGEVSLYEHFWIIREVFSYRFYFFDHYLLTSASNKISDLVPFMSFQSIPAMLFEW